jgi:co-chaperonin GroES (HSP10)
MDKVKAVGHRVIVKPDPVLEKTRSGIVLAVDVKAERTASQKGTVVGVGPTAWKNDLYGYGKLGWEPWCKVGDRIFFPRYGGKLICTNDGAHVADEDREYIIVINDEDVQCLILDESVEGVDDDK